MSDAEYIYGSGEDLTIEIGPDEIGEAIDWTGYTARLALCRAGASFDPLVSAQWAAATPEIRGSKLRVSALLTSALSPKPGTYVAYAELSAPDLPQGARPIVKRARGLVTIT